MNITNADYTTKIDRWNKRNACRSSAKKMVFKFIILSFIILSLVVFIKGCIPNNKEIVFAIDNPYKNNQTRVEYIAYESIGVEVVFDNANYETKKRLITDRLKYHNISDKDISTFINIFELESCRNKNNSDCFSTRKTPKTVVYHCERSNGSHVAVEIITRDGIKVQAHCEDYGYKTTYQEQSIGLAQILVTTWKGYKCEGDIYISTYEQQVDCAVKIWRQSGFYPWSTYKLINK